MQYILAGHRNEWCLLAPPKKILRNVRQTQLQQQPANTSAPCRTDMPTLNILFQRVLHRTLKFCCAMPSCSSLGTEIPKTASSCTELFSGVTIELFYDILMKMLAAKTDISCQPRTVTEKVHFLRIWHIPKGLNIFRNCYHLCLN